MHGMVAAPQINAVDAAASVLRRGGNAIDAAVTGAFVQMVVDPQMCGVAGFGVANVRAAGGAQRILDFNSPAGSRAGERMWEDIVEEQDWTGYGYHLKGQVNDVGYGSIMTPTTVAGMAELLRRFGTIEWKDALQPAIDYAENGFVVTPSLWLTWNMPSPEGRIGMFRRIQTTAASSAIYLKPNGQTPRPGERLKNPDYAAVLRRLADAGPEDFYHGELAQRMAEDLGKNGSYITAEDLANYQVRDLDPLEISYRGYRVTSNPPAGGGICMEEILQIVENEDIGKLGLNSLPYIDLVAHAMRAAYADWYGRVGDPYFVDVPVGELISDERAAEWYGKIKRGEHFEVPRYPEETGTTHITVIDEAGNCVAVTHSLGASSGVVTPGLGFTYNNNMNAANPQPGRPNSIAPGKTRITGMCPTIVFQGDEPVLALGAPGGTRIITGVTQVTLNVLDHRLSAVEAVSAPRFDCQGPILDCEGRIPSWVKDALAERDFQLFPNSASYGNFSRVQAIRRDPITQALDGGSDPRGSGGAVMEA